MDNIQLDAIKSKLEKQIEKMLDTIVDIEEFEQEEMWRIISPWHQVALSMCFQWAVLTPSFWIKHKDVTFDKKISMITDVWDNTYKHYLESFWFDARQDINNQKKHG